MVQNHDSKRVLAAHLAQLLASRPDHARTEHAKIMGVGDGTLGRILYATGNPTVEVLDAIAAYFRISTWQLLHPGDTAKSSSGVAESQSQPVSGEALMIAADIADEALRGLWLPKHQYYELVALALEGISQGLPYAQILEFVSPAAKKLAKSEVNDGGESGLGGARASGYGRRKAS